MIVQDLFKNVEINKLVENLIKNYESEKEFVEKNGYVEYKDIVELTINDFLHITPKINNDYIIVHKVYDYLDDDTSEYLDISIIHKKDIEKNINTIKDLIQNYNIEIDRNRDNSIDAYGTTLIERDCLLGYQLCENYLNKYNKYDVLAAIFNELTSFGYLNEINEEKVEQEKEILKERIEDVEKHPEKLVPINTMIEELFGENWKEIYDSIKIPTQEELNESIKINRKEIFEEINWIIDKLQI